MKNTLKVTTLVALALIIGGTYGLATIARADNNGNQMQALAPGQTGTAPGLVKNQNKNEFQNEFGDMMNKFNGWIGINAPTGLLIGPDGNTRVSNAKATAINGTTMTVSLLGLSLSVDTSQAQIIGGIILPPVSTSTVSSTPVVQQTSVSVGDMVSINGTLDATSGIIHAKTVRDLTTQSSSTSTIQNRIDQLMQLINQLRAQLQGSH
ncbi:MAG: hypothetical protein WC246_01005 [Candidatus Paceibacterota bacterium]